MILENDRCLINRFSTARKMTQAERLFLFVMTTLGAEKDETLSELRP